jgi:hypothetical protein
VVYGLILMCKAGVIQQPTKSVDDQVTRAETLFSNFVAQQNQDEACLEFNPSDSGLIAAKKA